MASNLTKPGAQHRGRDHGQSRKGDLTTEKITVGCAAGKFLELKNTHQHHGGPSLSSFASGSKRAWPRKSATEGGVWAGQADVKGVGGVWKRPDRLGELHGRQPDRAGGATSRKVTTGGGQRRLEPQNHGRRGAGEILELKNTINVMVDQLNAYRGRGGRRVARESRNGRQARRAGGK